MFQATKENDILTITGNLSLLIVFRFMEKIIFYSRVPFQNSIWAPLDNATQDEQTEPTANTINPVDVSVCHLVSSICIYLYVITFRFS